MSPLRRRVTTLEPSDNSRGGQWGSFVWGLGSWGGRSKGYLVEQEPATRIPARSVIPTPTTIADVESSSVVLSRFVIQAAGGFVSGRPWGTFVWGQDGWGVQSVTSSITRSQEPAARVVNQLQISRQIDRLRTNPLLHPSDGDIWGFFVWGQGKWGVAGPQVEAVMEREPAGRVLTGVKGS